jgi:predicted enzyme related to lactoylglutathione lyase
VPTTATHIRELGRVIIPVSDQDRALEFYTDTLGFEKGLDVSMGGADAAHADLLERGVEVDDEVMRMGDPVPPMFSFRDSEGNTLRLVELS